MRDIQGAGEPARLIGKNFIKGTCLNLQYRAHEKDWYGYFTGAVYWNYSDTS